MAIYFYQNKYDTKKFKRLDSSIPEMRKQQDNFMQL